MTNDFTEDRCRVHCIRKSLRTSLGMGPDCLAIMLAALGSLRTPWVRVGSHHCWRLALNCNPKWRCGDGHATEWMDRTSVDTIELVYQMKLHWYKFLL